MYKLTYKIKYSKLILYKNNKNITELNYMEVIYSRILSFFFNRCDISDGFRDTKRAFYC